MGKDGPRTSGRSERRRDVPCSKRARSPSDSPGSSPTTRSTSTLRRGEVHCLLGENGAGKTHADERASSGCTSRTPARSCVDGERVEFGSSSDAIARGIGMVHQHFQLIPVFTVAENVVLGDELRTRPGARPRHRAPSGSASSGEQYGLAVDPDAKVEDLSVGEQQRVELMKALFRNADILILDEPTAVLTPGEVDEFFGIVRSLVDQGKSIVFITHKLREVLARRRSHHRAAARPRRRHRRPDRRRRQQSLANLMVGRDVIFEIDKGPAHPGAPRLQVRDLSGARTTAASSRSPDLDLEVRAGEILGIAGVEGNGQRELVEAIAGMRPAAGGPHRDRRQRRHGRDARAQMQRARRRARPRGPRTSTASSPRSRSPTTSSSTRTTGSRSRGVACASCRESTSRPMDLVQRYDVRTPGINGPVSHLSGGNQQKVIIARELSGDSRCCSSPNRRAASTSARSSSSTDASSRCAMPAPRCCSCRPSSTRSSRCPTGSACSSAASSSASSTGPTPTRDAVGLLMASGRAHAEAGGCGHDAPSTEPSPVDREHGRERSSRRVLRSAAGARAVCAILLAFAVGSVIILLVGENPIDGVLGPAARHVGTRTASPGRSAARRRSSAPRSPSRSPSAPACSTSASKGSCSSARPRRRGSARGTGSPTCPRSLAVLVVLLAGVVGGALLRRDPRRVEGAHRRARGDHHDHAQRDRGAATCAGWSSSPGSGDPARHDGVGRRAPRSLPEVARLPDVRRTASRRCTSGSSSCSALVVFVWFVLQRTTTGFEIRMVGANPNAARYAGVSVEPRHRAGDDDVGRARRPGGRGRDHGDVRLPEPGRVRRGRLRLDRDRAARSGQPVRDRPGRDPVGLAARGRAADAAGDRASRSTSCASCRRSCCCSSRPT